MPGILWRVPGMLRDPLGPLAIRWGYLPKIAPWLLRFVAASGPPGRGQLHRAARAVPALPRCYRLLTEAAGIAHMIRDTGWLSVYRTGPPSPPPKRSSPCSAGAG